MLWKNRITFPGKKRSKMLFFFSCSFALLHSTYKETWQVCGPRTSTILCTRSAHSRSHSFKPNSDSQSPLQRGILPVIWSSVCGLKILTLFALRNKTKQKYVEELTPWLWISRHVKLHNYVKTNNRCIKLFTNNMGLIKPANSGA